MKLLNWVILIFLIVIAIGCSNNYDDGYENGYEKGKANGFANGKIEGYEKGLVEGYNKGYADGSEKNNKDITIVDLNLRASIRTSLKVFTVIFYSINIICLIAILYFLVVQRHPNIIFIVAKCLFLLMSIAISYLVLTATNFGHLVNPVLSAAQKWIIITLIFPATFGICMAVRKILINYNKIYNDIIAIILTTSTLVFFSFFLIDINVFVLTNEFMSYCIISVSAGGLGFSGYTLISDKMRNDKKSKSTEHNRR